MSMKCSMKSVYNLHDFPAKKLPKTEPARPARSENRVDLNSQNANNRKTGCC